ncbi:MAG TPA: ABC transporter permease [Candidatus Acidoferrales bacterium]|nr:ABC transporter permease [Candidatus Acidoferrales bacterium]
MNLLRALGRIRHMLIKEFLQTLRDPRTRFVLFAPPVIQMMVFGYAATLEVKHVQFAVLDHDNTQESREFISRLSASRYFDLQLHAQRKEVLRAGIDRGDFLLGIEIDSGFSQDLRGPKGAQVQVIVDSTNSNTALVGLGYVTQIGQAFAQTYQQDRIRRTDPQLMGVIPHVELIERPWFNEGFDSRWYFVPGVIGNLMLVMVMNLTAFAVVREREIGTLEQIMVTPIRRWEFILGKTLPFFLIGLFDAGLISLVGTFWFGVPFRGSVAVLAGSTMVFLLSSLGVGLFISTISANQQQAMVSAFFFIMPATTLSGFGTPISSMPPFFQKLTYLDPLRYFMIVLRSVYLKGVGFDVLWPQLAAMAAFAIVLLTVSILRFHKSLE